MREVFILMMFLPTLAISGVTTNTERTRAVIDLNKKEYRSGKVITSNGTIDLNQHKKDKITDAIHIVKQPNSAVKDSK